MLSRNHSTPIRASLQNGATERSRSRPAPTDLVLAGCLLMIAASVQANELDMDRGSSQVFALSPGSFVTDEVLFNGDGEVRGLAVFDQDCAQAPVQLPNGATIQSFLAWIEDPLLDQDVSVTLLRQPLGGAAVAMASFSTSGTSGLSVYSDLSVSVPTIDNALFSYTVWTCFSSSGGASANPPTIHGIYLLYSDS